MSKQKGCELDQVMDTYRAKMKVVGQLWSKLVHLGQCDVSFMKTSEEMLGQLEVAATAVLEEKVVMETARHNVLNLKQMLDVTRQTVDAKSQHLKMEEQRREEEQNYKLKEFNKIHKIQAEKATLERELVPSRAKLAAIMEKLSSKCDKLRHLEGFVDSLTDKLDSDLVEARDQTESARKERSTWDRFGVDVRKEVFRFPLNVDQLKYLRQSVAELKERVQNQNNWYEEELQTKLFYSSRNKEIQAKIAHFRTVVKRMERSGRFEEKDDRKDDSNALSEKSESVLIDGLPDIHAKDVEAYLSHQFGVRVLADYSMLRRLKEDIGVVGLAYLVERIRLQGNQQGNDERVSNRTFKDLEERQIETALQTIAMEYRDQEETRRRIHMADHPAQVNDHFSTASTDSPSSTGTRLSMGRFCQSPSITSARTENSFERTTDTTDVVTGTGSSTRQGSTSSLKSKSSMSRIKKMFKF